jgi:hypothetical protein
MHNPDWLHFRASLAIAREPLEDGNVRVTVQHLASGRTWRGEGQPVVEGIILQAIRGEFVAGRLR